MSARYGHKKIKRSLTHFILGKGISALANIIAMLLVVRGLTIGDFASYSILVALVDVITIISGFGIVNALLRYVPELYGSHRQYSLRNFVYKAVALRTFILFTVVSFAYFLSNQVTFLIGLSEVVSAYKLFLLLVFFRASSFLLSQVLESTLHQGWAQLGFVVSAIIKLLGMIYLLNHNNMVLMDVIWVEILSDFVGATTMLLGNIKIVSVVNQHEVVDDDGKWLNRNFRQVAKFSINGYFQHLALMPYGGNANRLVAGSLLSVTAIATYGFAVSIYEYIKRYLPTYLLVGLIRPIVLARYCENQDFKVAANLCNQVLQVNILLIAGMFVTLVVGGERLIAFITAEKYGFDALLILIALFLILLLESQRQQLDLLVQAVERNEFLILSNALLSTSIVLAFVFLTIFETPLVFPFANALGLIVANLMVQNQLSKNGFYFNHAWSNSILVCVITALSIAIGLFLKTVDINWALATTLATLIYLLSIYVFFLKQLKSFVRDLTGQNKSLPTLSNKVAFSKPTIVFGLLSSKNSAERVDLLASAVSPHHIYVHHDFSKFASFMPKAENVTVLDEPVETAWGDWSLVDATYRLMEKASNHKGITHFQLLSESCFPIRPIDEFEVYLATECPDVMMDICPLDQREVMWSHGWRYFSETNFSMRLLRRCYIWLCDNENDYIVNYSLNIANSKWPSSLIGQLKFLLAKCIINFYAMLFKRKLMCEQITQAGVGGQWFGASKRVVDWLIEARHQAVMFTRHYQQSHIPDESYVHSLILSAQAKFNNLKVYESNHAMSWASSSSGPDVIDDKNIEVIKESNKFFARKFTLDSDVLLRKMLFRVFK